MTSAVLFDMDGVLVNSEDFWVEFERDEILPTAVPSGNADVSEVSGVNFREEYDYLDEHYETALTREEFIDLFEKNAEELYTERVSLLEGVTDLLAELTDAGIPVAIVSSSPPAWIQMVVDRFDLGQYLETTVSVEEIDGPGKPEPDVYEHAADVLGFDPEECVAIEDSEHGVAAAAGAGVTTIAYRIDAHHEPDLSPAAYIVETPEELCEQVRTLAFGDGSD